MYDLMRRVATIVAGLVFVIVAVPLIAWILAKTGQQTSMWPAMLDFWQDARRDGLGATLSRVVGPIIGGALVAGFLMIFIVDLLDGPRPPNGPRYDDRDRDRNLPR